MVFTSITLARGKIARALEQAAIGCRKPCKVNVLLFNFSNEGTAGQLRKTFLSASSYKAEFGFQGVGYLESNRSHWVVIPCVIHTQTSVHS